MPWLLSTALLLGCAHEGAIVLPLDPTVPHALRAMGPRTRASLRRDALVVHCQGGALYLRISREAIDTGAHPILKVTLRHGSIKPVPLRVTISADRPATKTAAPTEPSWSTVSYPMDLGWWSSAAPRNVIVDLGHLPGLVPHDAFDGPVAALTLRIDAPPEEVQVTHVSLSPRSLASRVAVPWSRHDIAAAAPAAVVALAAALLWSITGVLLTVARLPRPLTAIVARNAVLRVLRSYPSTLLAVVAMFLATEAAVQQLLTVGGLRAELRRSVGLTERDRWALRDASIHADLDGMIRAATSVPEDAPVALYTQLAEARVMARYRLFPRTVLSGGSDAAPFRAYLGWDQLPGLGQSRTDHWLALTATSPVGQIYQLPPPSRFVAALWVKAKVGTLEADESLILLMYPNGMARRTKAVVTVAGTTEFRFDPPLWLPGNETYFELRHGGGGDGRVMLAASHGDPYPGGSAISDGAAVDADLAFRMWFLPEGYEPLRVAGSRSLVVRRAP